MLNAEPIEKHIFRNSEEYFSEKLHSFHDNFVDCFLLIGIDEANKAWDEIKMTKKPCQDRMNLRIPTLKISSIKAILASGR